MATAATPSVSLKLFIDTKSQKVLFAEAENDFVDFLFSLMALPIGTVTRLLTKDSMVGNTGYRHLEYFTDDPNMLYPHSFCKSKMSREMTYLAPSPSGNNTSNCEHGFVLSWGFLLIWSQMTSLLSPFLVLHYSIASKSKKLANFSRKKFIRTWLNFLLSIFSFLVERIVDCRGGSKTVLTSVFLPDSNDKSDPNSSGTRRTKRIKAH